MQVSDLDDGPHALRNDRSCNYADCGWVEVRVNRAVGGGKLIAGQGSPAEYAKGG